VLPDRPQQRFNEPPEKLYTRIKILPRTAACRCTNDTAVHRDDGVAWSGLWQAPLPPRAWHAVPRLAHQNATYSSCTDNISHSTSRNRNYFRARGLGFLAKCDSSLFAFPNWDCNKDKFNSPGQAKETFMLVLSCATLDASPSIRNGS